MNTESDSTSSDYVASLVIGVGLLVLSPVIAFLLSPIGCGLFPPVIDPNAWYIFSPCSTADFYAFWVILGIVLLIGTLITVHAIRSFKPRKK